MTSDSRMWVESEAGPSRNESRRQGYCGYCRVLYNHLDQHLSSLRHLDSVRASSRGPTPLLAPGNRNKLPLLERFLQDVLQHHPHHYKDSRPSHADLPSCSAPLVPRAQAVEFDDITGDGGVGFSDDDSLSGTRGHLPSSETVSSECQEFQTHSQSEGKVAQDRGTTPQIHNKPTHSQTPTHRKADRKSNRRKTSESLTSSDPPGSGHRTLQGHDPGVGSGSGVGPTPGSGHRPWLEWQKERRRTHRDEAFSSDLSDDVDQTIQEVIQTRCHGDDPDEMGSFHLSIPISMATSSRDWDTPAQAVLQQAQANAPDQVNQTEGRDLCGLMDLQVDLEDQLYSTQLDSALKVKPRCSSGVGPEQGAGFQSLPIEEVLPAPEYIPDSFRGKSWEQIEREDEVRINRLVRQFRTQHFICYFDSESLARYGRRSHTKRRCANVEEAGPKSGVLPLLDGGIDDWVSVRRSPKRKWRFRLASRCQVVKVSHGTQTIPLVIPRPVPEALPTTAPAANQEAVEVTPASPAWCSLPPSYSSIVSPVQPRTSLVYLLSSPSGPAPSSTPLADPALKRCRKKRRPLEPEAHKVKYKRLPVCLYEPGTNRILRTARRGGLRCRSSAHSATPPTFVRQLFRSLNPDLNLDCPPGGAKETNRLTNLLSTLSTDSEVRRRNQTETMPPPIQTGQKTRPSPSKKRGRGKRGRS